MLAKIKYVMLLDPYPNKNSQLLKPNGEFSIGIEIIQAI